MAEKAAAEEAKRVRRLAMIAEADMIPKGAFLWEAIYPKSEDGVTPTKCVCVCHAPLATKASFRNRRRPLVWGHTRAY